MKSNFMQVDRDVSVSDTHLPIIIKEVSKFFAIEDISSSNRRRDLVRARQYYYALARRFTVASMSKIGIEIGGKDHGTVSHGLKSFNSFYETEFEYRNDYMRLESTVKKRLKYASFNEDTRLREERIEYLKQRKKDIKRELKFLLEG